VGRKKSNEIEDRKEQSTRACDNKGGNVDKRVHIPVHATNIDGKEKLCHSIPKNRGNRRRVTRDDVHAKCGKTRIDKNTKVF